MLAGLSATLLMAGLWVAGFIWFLRVANGAPGASPPADAIVALTGGAGRVEAALRLLAENRARLLLVTGVGGDAAFPELARLAGVNAAEAALWARGHGIRSLIVVTAGYHMPRALAELARALPEVTLYPAPVRPPAPQLRLLAGEYTKFLAAEAGLTALDPRVAQIPFAAEASEHGG